MVQTKFLLLPASLWVALALQAAIASSVLAKVQESLPNIPNHHNHPRQISDNLPPPTENPNRTTGGGRRGGGSCPQDAKTSTQGLIALSPMTGVGLTLAERPTFLVYVPPSSAKTVEFTLLDQNNKGIYQTTFALTNTPGIVSFTPPSNAPSLEQSKNYTWFFALICDPKNRRRDQLVTGGIQRTRLDLAQMRQIQQAAPLQRVSLYRKANIWYEALSTLLDLQRTQPNDPNLKLAWFELLQSGGLNANVIQPLGK